MNSTETEISNVQIKEKRMRLSRVYKLCGKITAVVLTAFILLTCIVGHGELKKENFKYFLKYFEDNRFSISSKYEDSLLSGNSNMRFGLYKGDLAVLCDGDMILYDLSGRTLYKESCGKKIIDVKGKYIAAYSCGETGAVLYNSFSEVYNIKTDFPVLSVKVAYDGGFCVTELENGGCTVDVFNKAFLKIYTWSSLSRYVCCTGLSRRSDRVGIFTQSTDGGIEYAGLTVKETGTDKTVADFRYRGETPLGICFTDDGGFIAVTDKAIRFFSEKGTSENEYIYNGQLLCFDISSDNTSYAVRPEGTSQTKVFVYKNDGVFLFDCTCESRITKLESRNNIVCMSDGLIYVADKNGGKVKMYECPPGESDCFTLENGDILVCYIYGTKLIKLND